VEGRVVGRFAGIAFGFTDKPKIKEFAYGIVLVIPWESQYDVINLPDKNAELIVVDGKYCYKVTLNRPLAPDVIEPVACPYST
jgi:hypothetical protein